MGRRGAVGVIAAGVVEDLKNTYLVGRPDLPVITE
jgi:hypothetical protein